jgi:hypothetical protein
VKRSEIKVGEEYASTRSKDWTRWFDAKRVRVVHLGPFTEASSRYQARDMGVIDGIPTKDNYYRSDRGTYVAVRYIDDHLQPESRIRFVSVSHLKATWTDYLAEKAATLKARREADAREARRKEVDRAERAELDQIAARAGVALDFITRPGKVTISREDLRRLLDAALVKED